MKNGIPTAMYTPEPPRKSLTKRADTVNSPFQLTTEFANDETSTGKILRSEIEKNMTSSRIKGLLLILTEHLRYGMHRRTLMDEYERRAGECMDDDKMKSMDMYFQSNCNSIGSTTQPFLLEMYRGWFRIVPPKYNVRANIDAWRRHTRERIESEVRSRNVVKKKHSRKTRVMTA